MEAKETVISKEEMRLYCAKAYKDMGADVSPFAIDMTCPPLLCQAQAEISFTMGYNQALKDIEAGLSPPIMV